MQKIGEKIRDLRKAQKITQEELAVQLGISAQAISKWEKGQSMPDISLLMPLCNILGIGVDELLGGNRHKELEDKFQYNLALGPRVTLLISAEALREFPNDEKWLFRMAFDEYSLACTVHGRRKGFYIRKAESHFRSLTKKYPDNDTYRTFLAKVLFMQEQRNEAVAMAYDCKAKEALLSDFLSGDELIKHKQTVLYDKFRDFYEELLKYNSPDSLDLADDMTKLYLKSNASKYSRWRIYDKRADICLEKGDIDNFIINKSEAYNVSKIADNGENNTEESGAEELSDFNDMIDIPAPPLGQTDQFVSGDFSREELLALKRVMVEENLKIHRLHSHHRNRYVNFFMNKVARKKMTAPDFGTRYYLTRRELEDFEKRCEINPVTSDYGMLHIFAQHMMQARDMAVEGKISGVFAYLGKETEVAFCHCGDIKKYRFLDDYENKWELPCAKVFFLADISVAGDFENCGIENRMLDHLLERAKKAGYEYAEACPCEKTLGKEKYEIRKEILVSHGFDYIGDVFDTDGTKLTLYRKTISDS